MAEDLKRIPLSALKNLRREFGPGIAGKSAFRIIAKGVDCNSADGNGVGCSEKAVRTIDFDSPFTLEQIPVCGNDDCKNRVEERVNRECSARGKIPSFDMNGLGRH